jgi:hypothetical protein
MDIAGLLPDHLGDDVGEPLRGRDRRFRALLDDGTGDRARQPLLAKGVDEVGERRFALSPVRAMRMSSGPSKRKENPRSAWSSCMEETPMSSTTPSTMSWPRSRAAASRLEN